MENIKENNKLIAEFMGWKLKQQGIGTPFVYDTSTVFRIGGIHQYCHPNCLEFNSNWDWLMSVVEKIESLGFIVQIKTKSVNISWDNKGSFNSKMIESAFGKNKLQNTYDCVVSFIKWYNYKKEKL